MDYGDYKCCLDVVNEIVIVYVCDLVDVCILDSECVIGSMCVNYGDYNCCIVMLVSLIKVYICLYSMCKFNVDCGGWK